MDITTSTVQLSGEGGRAMDTHVAVPGGDEKRPALLVIMEVFGVNSHITDVTERFAREGYAAVAPDLYYRLQKGVAPYDDLQGAFAMRATLYEPKIIEDINHAITYLKSRSDVKIDKIGIIGYCFGGRVSWLAACQCPGLATAAVYYGGGIVGGERGEKSPFEPVTLANKIKIPLQCVWGEEDELISKEAREKIQTTLNENKVKHEWFVYKGAGHAFFTDDQPSYHESSAKDAWSKTLAFFARHLKA